MRFCFFSFFVLLFLSQSTPLEAQIGRKFRQVFRKKQVQEAPHEPKTYLYKKEEWRYEINQGKAATQGYLAVESQYDSLGFLTTETYLSPKRDTQARYRYEYPEKGNKMRKYLMSKQGNFLELEESYFGEQHQLSAQVFFKTDGSILHRFLYEYDLNNRLYQTIHYNEKNEQTYSLVRSYHEFQPSYTEFYRDLKNGEDYQLAIQYDTLHNPIESLRYKASGELVEKILFQYDEQGRLTERALYKSGGEVLDMREVYEYPDAEKTIKSLFLGKELLDYTIYVHTYQTH